MLWFAFAMRNGMGLQFCRGCTQDVGLIEVSANVGARGFDAILRVFVYRQCSASLSKLVRSPLFPTISSHSQRVSGIPKKNLSSYPV
jgi:hypothetical protein